ncbi:MAG: exodeoxyribonuclease VII large subunit [Candidatus Baltobacteraceae bacterium]
MQEPLFVTPRIEGVSRVVNYIGRLLKQNKQLHSLAVRGEVSNFRILGTGRMYFDLKEGRDILACVAWENRATGLPPFKNGDEIVATGDFGIYADQSKYQLVVNSVQLSGVGNLHAQIETLKEKFRREGLFEAGRKRPMPAFPLHVALLSARGKGAEDFFETAGRRAPHLQITFVETRVQGFGAEIEIAQAIDRASSLDVDVIVLARGGGSFEDRFPFNLEPVVRAIVRSKYPVLTAIGHTGDHHLSDEVADFYAETPSNAAQYFGAIRDIALTRLARLQQELSQNLRSIQILKGQHADIARESLQRCAVTYTARRHQRVLLLERRLDAKRPVAQMAQRTQRLERASARLHAVAGPFVGRRSERIAALFQRFAGARTRTLAPAASRLEKWQGRLLARDPQAQLKAGYAILTHNGELVRSAFDVKAGEKIEAQLEHGRLEAVVERVAPDGG